MINILDCTIRDGSYSTNFFWETQTIEKIVSSLDYCGIKFIEIGNGTGLGAYRSKPGALDDITYIRHAVKAKRESKIGAFFIPGIGEKTDIKQFHEEGGDFIRIGTNANETTEAIDYIEYAKSLGLFVCHNFMKTYAITKFQFIANCDALIKSGVDCIYVVDSAGGMLPNQIENLISAFKDTYSIDIGFHGHNNLSLANANSLSAIQSGATFVDSTILGLGRGSGNAQTATLIALLQKANYLRTSFNIDKIIDLGNELIQSIIDGNDINLKRELIIGLSNFHDSNTPLLEQYANKYKIDSNELLKEVCKINVINPTEDLFNDAAQKIKMGKNKNVFTPKFSHKKY